MDTDRFIVDFKDLIITRAVEKHLSGKHDQSTHGKKRGVAKPVPTKTEGKVATRKTKDSDYYQHSGYASMPEPTDDLEVAKETGAPIRWLMPASMETRLADVYDKALKDAVEDLENSPFVGGEVAILNSAEVKFNGILSEMGMGYDDAGITASALRMRLNEHVKHRYNRELSWDEPLGQIGNKKFSEKIVFGESPNDHFVGIHVYEPVLKSIIGDGRYKTQFETQSSNGYLNTGERAKHETASFSLHPSVSPSKRPVYGAVYKDGYNFDTSASASQYGSIVLVLRGSSESRATWTQFDSLGTTTRASSITNPTAHGVIRNRPNDSWEYTEGQVHGGVSLKDIKTIIVPDVYGDTVQEIRSKLNIPESIEIIPEGVALEGALISKEVKYDLPKGATLVATSWERKLYVDKSVNNIGYLVDEQGKVYQVNPYDIYARGYWTDIPVD